MSNYRETTIYDIAEKLNISPATVSRGLKDHPGISKITKNKILETAKLLGYRTNTFARNLRRQKTNTLGVIVPRLNSSFMSDVIAGMEKIANDRGYNLIISQSLETEQKEKSNAITMFNNRVDGLLVSVAYNTKDINHFLPFFEKNIPVIFFDRIIHHNKCSSVLIDNFKAAYDITSHLIAQGCTKLLHIAGNLQRNVYIDRYNGFLKAIHDHNLEFRKDWLMINDLSAQAGIDSAKQVMQMTEKPDGVFVANDNCAANFMIGLKKQDIKVPSDICIAGFNNDPIATIVEPNLTTINYKGFEMGQSAVLTLINHLNLNQRLDDTQTIILRHELIIRDSTLRNP